MSGTCTATRHCIDEIAGCMVTDVDTSRKKTEQRQLPKLDELGRKER